jgi:hypothetical protein
MPGVVIHPEDLNGKYFETFDRIEARTDSWEIEELWNKRAISPLETKSRKARETRILCVLVASLQDADLQPVKDKIEELRPDRRPPAA